MKIRASNSESHSCQSKVSDWIIKIKWEKELYNECCKRKKITGYYQVRDYKGNNITTLSPKELEVFMAAVGYFTSRKYINSSIMNHGAKGTLNVALLCYIQAGLEYYEVMKKNKFETIYSEVQHLKYAISLINKFRDISEDQAETILISVSRNKAIFSIFDYRDEETEIYKVKDCSEHDLAVKNLTNEVEGLIDKYLKPFEIINAATFYSN